MFFITEAVIKFILNPFRTSFILIPKDREWGGWIPPCPILKVVSNDSSIHTKHTLHNLVRKFSVLRLLGLKKASKFAFFQTQNLNFLIFFSKIFSLENNYSLPFYPPSGPSRVRIVFIYLYFACNCFPEIYVLNWTQFSIEQCIK